MTPNSEALHVLYTAGYTGRDPAEILAMAQMLGATIVDVRLHPRSRVEHWNGYALRRYLEAQGQRYHHIPALGNLNYKTPNLPIELKDPEMGAFELRGLLKKSCCVILCSCKCPDECHRSTVAGLMSQIHGVCFEHLTQRKDEAHHEQLDQLSLF